MLTRAVRVFALANAYTSAWAPDVLECRALLQPVWLWGSLLVSRISLTAHLLYVFATSPLPIISTGDLVFIHRMKCCAAWMSSSCSILGIMFFIALRPRPPLACWLAWAIL